MIHLVIQWLSRDIYQSTSDWHCVKLLYSVKDKTAKALVIHGNFPEIVKTDQELLIVEIYSPWHKMKTNCRILLSWKQATLMEFLSP